MKLTDLPKTSYGLDGKILHSSSCKCNLGESFYTVSILASNEMKLFDLCNGSMSIANTDFLPTNEPDCGSFVDGFLLVRLFSLFRNTKKSKFSYEIVKFFFASSSSLILIHFFPFPNWSDDNKISI